MPAAQGVGPYTDAGVWRFQRDLMGWGDKVGALAPGFFADLIALDGDPLRDITELERVRFVMK